MRKFKKTISETLALLLASGLVFSSIPISVAANANNSSPAATNQAVAGNITAGTTSIGECLAIIEPSYPGMSLTIGQPAIIDGTATKDKFPVFNASGGVAGTVITGTVIAPDGSVVYTIPETKPDEKGNAAIAIPDSVPLKLGTYKVAFTLTNGNRTLYDAFYFTAIENFAAYKYTKNEKNSLNANVANVNPDSPQMKGKYAAPYPAVQLDESGKLVYFPDYKGNKIMDYSMVGYKGGAEPIPDVPVRITVKPLSDPNADAWFTIQNAINYVSSLPLQPDGYRGAVYLEEGVYRISKPLIVNASGVVIRGAGEGKVSPVVGKGTSSSPYDQQIASEEFEPGVTKLISTWKITDKPYTPPNDHQTTSGSPFSLGTDSTLIYFSGKAPSMSSVQTTVTDQYVGAGQNQIHVESVDGFKVGDIVVIKKIVNFDWAKTLYMDKIDGANNWASDGKLVSAFANGPFNAERTIKAIDPEKKLITLEEPLSDSLDRRWGVSKVIKLANDGRITNVGVENIQAISHFYNLTKPALNKYGVYYKSYNDENHPLVFITMDFVRDGFVRNFITYHIDRAFNGGNWSRNITIQDGSVLDPVSLMNAGERRYSIYFRKTQFGLAQRIYARYNRHAFIVDSYTCGPNVFYNCVSEFVTNSSEPHFRWSSGGLYDNVTARIAIQNRWSSGTAHGWAGVNYVLYNCTGPFTISQPPLAANYLIGHYFNSSTNKLGSVSDPSDGRVNFGHTNSDNMKQSGLNGGRVPNFPAYEYSVNALVTPQKDNMPSSLYLQQFIERYGSAAKEYMESKSVPTVAEKEPASAGQEKGPSPVTVTFDDISEASWAKTSIETLASKGILAGVGNNLFRPNDTVTRAQFVTMLVKAFGLEDSSAVSSYSDVAKNSWYYMYVATAEKLGLVSGKGEGKFEPDSNITREEMAVLINNFVTKRNIKLKQANIEAQAFADQNEISGWAKEAVSNMQKAGIISGQGNNRFSPKGNLTRAEAAAVFYKLLFEAVL